MLFGNWGLDFVDNPGAWMDSRYKYMYSGKGVEAYVLDTGLKSDHVEFGGRAYCGSNFYDNVQGCRDEFDHGTHVAAILGVSWSRAVCWKNLIVVLKKGRHIRCCKGSYNRWCQSHGRVKRARNCIQNNSRIGVRDETAG